MREKSLSASRDYDYFTAFFVFLVFHANQYGTVTECSTYATYGHVECGTYFATPTKYLSLYVYVLRTTHSILPVHKKNLIKVRTSVKMVHLATFYSIAVK